MEFKCPHCGCNIPPVYRTKGPHIGEYCTGCDRWVRWIPKSKYNKMFGHIKKAQDDLRELSKYDIEEPEVPW